MSGAHWLIERFGVTDAIIGDVVEQSGHRSRLWLWKQTVAAVLTELINSIGTHPFVFARGVIIGGLLLMASRALVEWAWKALSVQWVILVVSLGLRHQLNPLTGLLRTTMAVPLWFAVAWLVRRYHRVSAPATILTMIAVMWALAAPGYSRLLLNAIDSSRFVPYAIVNGVGLVAFTASVLAGALWSSSGHATP